MIESVQFPPEKGPSQLRIGDPLLPIRIAIISISDSRTIETDTSGELLTGRVNAAGHILAAHKIVADDIAQIRQAVLSLIDADACDAIITTGGTGLTGRDVTPEALRPLFEKEIDGFSTVFHMVSYGSVGLSTLQSRALAGIVKGVFIFALPGSNGACRDGWDKIIRYQLDARHIPCNLVEIMPRLGER